MPLFSNNNIPFSRYGRLASQHNVQINIITYIRFNEEILRNCEKRREKLNEKVYSVSFRKSH